MQDSTWITIEARRTLDRLLPQLEAQFDSKTQFETFKARLEQHFPRAFRHLYEVYGGQYDFFYHLQQILYTVEQMFLFRPDALHTLDQQREDDPFWFQHERMVGGVCYVDLFAGTLNGVKEKIPYFKELGLTYVHLMPLFAAPENSDGGYAISDYREVNPELGTMADLAKLADELRANGISLVLDFVFNHTSDEHEWALKAKQGDPEYERYYYLFPDRTLPDQYEQTLREIFPEQSPGNYTYIESISKWAWTTFRAFQWDLNYSNPEVFNAMLGEMLFLANQGVEVLRFDAVAFIWKRMGTPCENLPEVHHIIRAFNALTRIAAPSVLFKSEAIVHPDDVASYIHPEECQLSYNPTFMACIWEALATREVKLLRHSMSKRWEIADGASWVNYVRVHDDIGWSFANEDAQEVGINGFDHRLFLNDFYTGKFPGSFANGVPFNFNPKTLDTRICGSCASLAGLEQAITLKNDEYIEHAIRRILLIHSLIIATGGIPLIYINDELATLNDYSYRSDPNKVDDNRWVHRPYFDWKRAEKRHDESTIPGRVFQSLTQMIRIRKAHLAFADAQTTFFDSSNRHVLGLVRNRMVLVLANFSEYPQIMDMNWLAAYWRVPRSIVDLYTGVSVNWADGLTLAPYQFVWLRADEIEL